MSNKSCRLCLTSSDGTHLNIFSEIGNEMKISDIISEHFKCDVNEIDPLPNYVCAQCWSTTEAFHDLYQKSKTMQERFLNPLIKVETDELWHNKETAFVEETHFEIGDIKIEPTQEDDLDSNEVDMNYADSDGNYQEGSANDSANDSSNDSATECSKTDIGNDSIASTRRKRTRKCSTRGRPTKIPENEFQKLFAENKHRLDMTCDSCETTFDSLDDARSHYLNVHNNTKGYVKCCDAKLQYRCQIVAHLQRHLITKNYQ